MKKLFRILNLLILLFAWPVMADDLQLSILSIPDGADVYMDDHLAGVTPITVQVKPGSTIHLLIKKSGYLALDLDYTVKKSEKFVLDLGKGIRLEESDYITYKEQSPKSAGSHSSSGSTGTEGTEDDASSRSGKGSESGIPNPTIKEIPVPPDALFSMNSYNVSFKMKVNNRGEIISCLPTLDRIPAAVDQIVQEWVQQWQLEPARVNGFPLSVDVQFTVTLDPASNTLEIPEWQYQFSRPHSIARSTEPKPQTSSTPSPTPLPTIPKKTSDQQPTAAVHTPKQTDTPTKQADSDESTASQKPSPMSANPDYLDVSKLQKHPEILQPPKFGAIPLDIQNLNIKREAGYRILIGVDGKVKEAEIVRSSGNDALDHWILPNLISTEWIPGTIDDKPVACWKELTLSINTRACKFDVTNLFSEK